MYSVFSTTPNNQLLEPMFLGANVNVSRYDQQKYSIFEELIDTQLSFFWRPEEIDISKDRIDFKSLTPAQVHIFLSNLKYQTLLDSIQGRAPNIAFLPLVSLPELETWIETWSFSETIHSRSYTHIIRGIVEDPSIIFDDIVVNEFIKKRAVSIGKYYDKLISLTHDPKATKREIAEALYMTLMCVNILEAIRFYVSFCCSFSFAENKIMEGNAKIIKLIARDEALHLTGTQFVLNTLASGAEGDMFKEIAFQKKDECIELFRESANQELDWVDYLFSEGSMLGLNSNILKEYVKYITNIRMKALNLDSIYPDSINNPVPWMTNWLVSDNVQVAPQEVEISSYLVGQLDSNIDDSITDFEL